MKRTVEGDRLDVATPNPMKPRRMRSAPMRSAARAVSVAIGALALTALSLSCAHAQHPRGNDPHKVTGTCTGACRHYVTCKHDSSGTLYDACVSQCRTIYSDRGVEDHATLRDFERLDCPATVSFVEGSSGREPTLPQKTGTESALKK